VRSFFCLMSKAALVGLLTSELEAAATKCLSFQVRIGTVGAPGW
jgi:hypothetical protein